jgi:translation elongation factor EF-G
MGKVQIEVLNELLKSRFGLDVDISEPEVQYYEAITEVCRGFCHYEPKKHYAEVEIEISPRTRGQGIEFVSTVSTDDLPLQYQNAIRKAVPEALQHGSLVGRPLKDVLVRLIAGKHHLEHTHGGDFRIATIRAIQQALENNRCTLLEPLNAVNIIAGQELAGRILADIIKMHGSYDEPTIDNGRVSISGLIPVATSLNYPLELNSLSSGTARMMLRTGGLQECHNTNEVLEILKDNNEETRQANGENEDILYNSVSLFRKGRKMHKITND